MQLSLHKEPPEVGLVKKLTGSLHYWVIRHVPLSDIYGQIRLHYLARLRAGVNIESTSKEIALHSVR